MIIKNLSTKNEEYSVTVSADIKVNNETEFDHIYFKVRKIAGLTVSADATPFVALTLFIAMWRGEDILVEGSLSLEFYNNISHIMDLLSSWEPHFKKINVIYNNLTSDTFSSKGSSCFFSLGVDSFYTYLKHKNTPNPINNFIFVHGFDIALENMVFFSETLKKIDELAEKESLNIFSVETNLRKFTDRYLEWDWEHGGAMAAVSMFLRANFSRTYFAGSDSSTQRGRIIPYGTHPDLDPLWQTETFKVIHDGNESTRLQKIQNVVSKSELALDYLRVCNQNLKDKYNCSKCEKCIRTMIDLQITESLPFAKTFKKDIPFDKLIRIDNSHFETQIYFEDSLNELKKLGKYPELQDAIELSLKRSANPSKINAFIKQLSGLDKRYNKSRINNFIFGTTKNGDRNQIFKFLANKSIIR
jgi:hypothetical protein